MTPNQGGERTEKATPKKRRDARERGQVLKSTEINHALSLLILFGALYILHGFIYHHALELIQTALSEQNLMRPSMNGGELYQVAIQSLRSLALMSLPILGVALFSGLLVNYVQVGFLFTTQTLMPKFSRISPIQGFKRIFSMRTLVELVKSLLKISVILWVTVSTLQPKLPEVPNMLAVSPWDSFGYALGLAGELGLKISLALLILALADYLFQWWQYEKDLRMTKQEIKDEYKLTEGDPQIKGQIRQKQRQMAAMRMMQSVPEADVVITNPTHYAIALRYQDGTDSAPVVLAKGKGHLALRIREIASQHGVERVENRALAHALYASCEVGDAIPEQLYQSVAEVLAYVYRMKQGNRPHPK